MRRIPSRAVNVNGYGEFDNNARPDGLNIWRPLTGTGCRTVFAAADTGPGAAQLKHLTSDNWVQPEFGP